MALKGKDKCTDRTCPCERTNDENQIAGCGVAVRSRDRAGLMVMVRVRVRVTCPREDVGEAQLTWVLKRRRLPPHRESNKPPYRQSAAGHTLKMLSGSSQSTTPRYCQRGVPAAAAQ